MEGKGSDLNGTVERNMFLRSGKGHDAGGKEENGGVGSDEEWDGHGSPGVRRRKANGEGVSPYILVLRVSGNLADDGQQQTVSVVARVDFAGRRGPGKRGRIQFAGTARRALRTD